MNQRQMPKVSLGLPVYNGERFIETALKCLLGQTFENFEIVISDNASTDRTAEICRDYTAQDSRIRYVANTTNLGAAPNFGRVFHLAQGEFFKWVAHDDVYAPNYLERCMAAFEADPALILVYTDFTLVDEHDRPLRHDRPTDRRWDAAEDSVMSREPMHLAEAASTTERFRDILHRTNWCIAVFGVIRSEHLRKTGLQRSYYGADKVLLAELALQGRFLQLDEELFCKRVHDDMSFKLSVAEKRKWIDSRNGFHIPQLLMLRDYIRMLMNSPLLAKEKYRCLGIILGMVRRSGLWNRILVPGPDNYLGINLRFSSRPPEK